MLYLKMQIITYIRTKNITSCKIHDEKGGIMEHKERVSGIELLKIFAVVIIVFSHAMPVPRGDGTALYYMDLSLATGSIQRFIIVLFKYGGQLGNDIFIISSAWFLLESRKMNMRKVMYMIGDCFVVSVLFLICFLAFGYRIGVKEIIKQLMPTYMAANWFICCYLLFYMIHPALNIVLERLDQEKLFAGNMGLIFVYCGLQVLRPGSMYYSQLIGFVCIYFIVAYVKKYMEQLSHQNKANITILFFSLSGNLALIFITNLLGMHINLFSKQLTRWCQFMNPFLILTALSMFMLAKEKKFVSRPVNYISGLSLLIYIIHANKLIMDHLIGDIFKYIYYNYSYKYELVWVTVSALCLLTFGTVLSIIYKSVLQRTSHKICSFICDSASKLCRWIFTGCIKTGTINK